MAELPAELAATLGGAYTLERELGGAGMSRVFLAEERSLGRRVVVKVLPSEMSSRASIERFKREIALAARLQHPHIVPLLSAGETEGQPYFTMPFIEGESLRARLTRSGEFQIPDARACREHDPHVMGINVLNPFARMRGEERFIAISRRLGLE